MITLKNGEARPITGFSGIDKIDKGKPAVFILDDEEVLEGYITEGKGRDGEAILVCLETGKHVTVTSAKIIGWCYY